MLFRGFPATFNFFSNSAGQAGHERGHFLGKDDSCDTLWPSIHELFIFGINAVTE